MIKAIVYLSNTGYTEEYAGILGDKTGLPVFDLDSALVELPQGTDVVFLGWVAGGRVNGYKDASEHFCVRALCAVGLSSGEEQLAKVRKMNEASSSMRFFVLPGGFDMDRLHGSDKLLMMFIRATVGRFISWKRNKSADDIEMLDLLYNGGSRVSADKLSGVLDFLEQM